VGDPPRSIAQAQRDSEQDEKGRGEGTLPASALAPRVGSDPSRQSGEVHGCLPGEESKLRPAQQGLAGTA